ncbi:hypothetical protein [Elioraea sp.]
MLVKPSGELRLPDRARHATRPAGAACPRNAARRPVAIPVV